MQDLVSLLPPGFTPWDVAAVALLMVAMFATIWAIEWSPFAAHSMSTLMQRYRHEWMHQFALRENRILDSALLASLRQGTAFYASASMIAVGGIAALLGRAEALQVIAADLALEGGGRRFWEIKLLFVLAFVAHAFLKFAWAHRLFGYLVVLLGAIPAWDGQGGAAFDMANRASVVHVSAARSFNRGLRSIYFGLAALAWVAGPLVLAVATLLVVGMLMRREFFSSARHAVARPAAHK